MCERERERERERESSPDFITQKKREIDQGENVEEKGSVYFKVIKSWPRGRVVVGPQIKWWSTSPCGSVAATP